MMRQFDLRHWADIAHDRFPVDPDPEIERWMANFRYGFLEGVRVALATDATITSTVERALTMTRERLVAALTAATNGAFIAGVTGDIPLEVRSRESYYGLQPWLDAVDAAIRALAPRSGAPAADPDAGLPTAADVRGILAPAAGQEGE